MITHVRRYQASRQRHQLPLLLQQQSQMRKSSKFKSYKQNERERESERTRGTGRERNTLFVHFASFPCLAAIMIRSVSYIYINIYIYQIRNQSGPSYFQKKLDFLIFSFFSFYSDINGGLPSKKYDSPASLRWFQKSHILVLSLAMASSQLLLLILILTLLLWWAVICESVEGSGTLPVPVP